MRYGTQNLIDAANMGNVEAQLLTSALVMIHERAYPMCTPEQVMRELIEFHRKLVERQRSREPL